MRWCCSPRLTALSVAELTYVPDAPPASTGAPARTFLVPAVGFRQEAVIRLLSLAWLAFGVQFWIWWLQPDRGPWTVGRIVATVGLAWPFLFGGYFLFFACRMTRPNPALPVPAVRVAMVVTKAPSEPWPLVRRTLTAMLEQAYPHSYDVWLADEKPSRATSRWCAARGVRISSRWGVPSYQQAAWPRRARCKEGNLAWFYDNHGYADYDVVAQLDADHVPAVDYLANVVRPFADPAVGYVAAPSVCDANASVSWTVRGRLYKEAVLHGAVQAGANGGFAPVCIGSHYAVRTAALASVGGLGPDLAEDYSTTLWLLAGRWEGVFALDAHASGEGPESLRDMLTQEIQWARSLGTILTRWAPGRMRALSWRARPRMAFTLLFYPLQGLFCVLGTALPIYGVVSHSTWGNASLAGFYAHLWAPSMLLTLVVVYARRCKVLRPAQVPLFSWELMLFGLVRWPFVAWSFAAGMWAGLGHDESGFRVTPKGASGRQPFTTWMVAPTAVLSLAPALVVVSVSHPGSVLGLYLVAATQAVTYALSLIALVLLQVRANARIAGVTGVTGTVDAFGRVELLCLAGSVAVLLAVVGSVSSAFTG